MKRKLKRKEINDVDLFVFDGEGFVKMDEGKHLDEYALMGDSSVLFL